MDNIDPALVKALEDGTYVVDPYAVAGAIMARQESLAEARRLSAVLVAPQGDEPAAGTS